MATVEDIRRGLAARPPRLIAADGRRRAAVAAIFHEGDCGLRLLLIERAEREGDPWSGHLAFPGGRVAGGDRDARAAAERETLEEVGLDLRKAEFLGRLDDLSGTAIPVVVSGFVYRTEAPGPLAFSAEVREAFWVAAADLADPGRHAERTFPHGGTESTRPCIDLFGPGRPLLWGITYRFVTQLVGLMGHDAPKAHQEERKPDP